MTHGKNHPYYEKVEEAIKPHLEKYGEPWQYRESLIQDILDALFREPYNIVDWRDKELQKLRDKFDNTAKIRGFHGVDHGIDIIGDEHE